LDKYFYLGILGNFGKLGNFRKFGNFGEGQKVTSTLYANVSFEKPIFTFIKHFASMIPIILFTI